MAIVLAAPAPRSARAPRRRRAAGDAEAEEVLAPGGRGLVGGRALLRAGLRLLRRGLGEARAHLRDLGFEAARIFHHLGDARAHIPGGIAFSGARLGRRGGRQLRLELGNAGAQSAQLGEGGIALLGGRREDARSRLLAHRLGEAEAKLVDDEARAVPPGYELGGEGRVLLLQRGDLVGAARPLGIEPRLELIGARDLHGSGRRGARGLLLGCDRPRLDLAALLVAGVELPPRPVALVGKLRLEAPAVDGKAVARRLRIALDRRQRRLQPLDGLGVLHGLALAHRLDVGERLAELRLLGGGDRFDVLDVAAQGRDDAVAVLARLGMARAQLVDVAEQRRHPAFERQPLARRRRARDLGLGGEARIRLLELVDALLQLAAFEGDGGVEALLLGGDVGVALAQARFEAGDRPRRLGALLVEARAHAGDVAVGRIEVLGESLDALPQLGALADIGGAQGVELGAHRREAKLQLGILGREGGVLGAKLLDRAFEDGDLGTAARDAEQGLAQDLLANVVGNGLPRCFGALAQHPLLARAEAHLLADQPALGRLVRRRKRVRRPMRFLRQRGGFRHIHPPRWDRRGAIVTTIAPERLPERVQYRGSFLPNG